jgi:23S rRNA (adenine2503-C2)-methyltransferase
VDKKLIMDYSLDELKTILQEAGFQGYRAKQIWDWMYGKFVGSFDEMANIPKTLREYLKEHFYLSPYDIVEASEGTDSTKYLLRSKIDGELIEAVYMNFEGKDDTWHTACISVQVGCPVGCKFCQTGLSGFSRNLTAGEIIGQIWIFEHMKKEVDRIVFMGMGEPLLNFDNVYKSIKVFTDKRAFGMSPRRITLSTVGIIEGMKKLLDSDLKVHLAVSVHAPLHDLRMSLVPVEDSNPIDKVLDMAHQYAKDRGVRLTAEYVMLDGINDSLEHAEALARLLRGKVKRINLIPYNDTFAGFRRPPEERILAFQNYLKNKGFIVTVRKSVGKDVDAACGMLRRRNL